MSFNSNYKSVSGQLQNNSVKGGMLITMNPDPVFDQVSVWLSDAVHRNIDEKCALFLKNNSFLRVFLENRDLNVPFCDDIGRCLYCLYAF